MKYETLASLTDEEVKQIVELNAKKEASESLVELSHKKLVEAKIANDEFFNELRRKYQIPDGPIHYNLRDKVIRKGYWREENE